jgi:hypothetical protein
MLKADLVIPLAVAAALALLTWLVYVPAAVRRGRVPAPVLPGR